MIDMASLLAMPTIPVNSPVKGVRIMAEEIIPKKRGWEIVVARVTLADESTTKGRTVIMLNETGDSIGPYATIPVESGWNPLEILTRAQNAIAKMIDANTPEEKQQAAKFKGRQPAEFSGKQVAEMAIAFTDSGHLVFRGYDPMSTIISIHFRQFTKVCDYSESLKIWLASLINAEREHAYAQGYRKGASDGVNAQLKASGEGEESLRREREKIEAAIRVADTLIAALAKSTPEHIAAKGVQP